MHEAYRYMKQSICRKQSDICIPGGMDCQDGRKSNKGEKIVCSL